MICDQDEHGFPVTTTGNPWWDEPPIVEASPPIGLRGQIITLGEPDAVGRRQKYPVELPTVQRRQLGRSASGNWQTFVSRTVNMPP